MSGAGMPNELFLAAYVELFREDWRLKTVTNKH